MQVGKGVKTEKAEKVLAKAGGLVEGEVVWFYAKCNNFRPMVDAIVVTNARVLGLSTLEGYKYKAPVTQITATEYDPKKGTVQIVTTDGQVMTLKSVSSDDVQAVEHYVDYARANPSPPNVTDAIAALGAAGTSVLAAVGAAPTDFKAAKKAHKEEIKKERAQEKAEKDAADRATAGEQVESAMFGLKTVMIHQNGYVRVGGAMFTANAQYERLISIEASSDVSKKSGLGRGAAAVMTMGVNLAGSNKRGDVYLTIVTDRTTHVLHEDPPTAMNLKASKKLEAAGNAVIRANAVSPAHAEPTESPGDAAVDTAGAQEGAVARSVGGGSVSDKLRELTAMRDEGLVSIEEFQALRAKLLKSF
jgi:hypothetical protein